MEKRDFARITQEIFLDYGFQKVSNRYVLELPDVSIVVVFASARGVKYFYYYFSINALYDTSTDVIKRFDTVVAETMEHSPNAAGYHKQEILYEDYSESQYRELLTGLLHTYFDGYCENALEHIKKLFPMLMLSQRAKDFLNLT